MILTMWVPKEYNSGHKSEKRTTINVNEKYYLMYQIKTGPVRAGDIIQVLAEAHLTNDLHKPPYDLDPKNTNVYITGSIIAATKPSAVTSANAGGTNYEITEPAGQNFDSRVHHFRLVSCGTITIPVDHPEGLYVSFCGKSGSTKSKSSWKITLDDDQGRLGVIHHSQVDVEIV